MTDRVARWLYHYTENRPCRLIRRDGEHPYLERYFVGRRLGLTIYLHRFVAPDGDEAVHDHPWRALSLGLTGTYTEERLVAFDASCSKGWVSRIRIVRRGTLGLLGLRSFHRILRVKPGTWTLFVHGHKRKGWGFLHGGDGRTTYEAWHLPSPEDWWLNAPLGRDSERQPLLTAETCMTGL